MKISIPTDEKSLDSNVCILCRTPYYLIYDTDTEESVFIDNSVATSAVVLELKLLKLL